MTDLPARIGPVEFGRPGGWVTVRCPREVERASEFTIKLAEGRRMAQARDLGRHAQDSHARKQP